MINEDALMARVIHIDSRLRRSGRAEEMTYELNEPIHLPRGTVCWCTAITLPFSITNVTSLNDTLHYTERTVVGSTTRSEQCQVAIPAGEYNRSLLAQAIQEAMNARASILPPAVSYKVDNNSEPHALVFSQLWNEEVDRYDFTGSYEFEKDGETLTSNVYRDWRSLTDSSLREYVMSPTYQWGRSYLHRQAW